jgi:RNA polymerase-associated protein CTR9
LLILTNSTFRALAGDKSGALPYDADLADQRARYGDGLLRRAPEQITKQEAYESEAHARVEEVRKLRQAEAERIRAAEVCPFYLILKSQIQSQGRRREKWKERADIQDQRRAELAAKAEEITAVRRAAQEEARKWAEEEQARELEEEQRRAANMEKRKKKPKDEVISGDELMGGEKKKRKTTTKKSKKKKEEDAETESDAPSGVETGEEEGEDMIEKRKRETLALLKARSKVCSVL